MRYRVYIKPFDDSGNYVPDFIEVTNDVNKLTNTGQSIDNTEYDVGIIKNTNITLTLKNDKGYYSSPLDLRSMFRTKRKNSLVKITFDMGDYPLICNFFKAGGEILNYEQTIFTGVLNETNSAIDVFKQQISFTCLGFESLLNEIPFPFADVVNGDNASEVMYKMFNQSPFNELVVVDTDNITLNYDAVLDDVSDFATKTCGEQLAELLITCNSVMYIKDGTVYVTNRDATEDIKYSFYGQASIIGTENIINLPSYRDGLNRVFNYWTWKETTLFSADADSILTYGTLKKEINDFSFITNNTTKQTVLDRNKADFKIPKIEIDIVTPQNYDTLALSLLDRVNIDYPNVYTSQDGDELPRYGLNIYGAARYPYGEYSLTITQQTDFKIISRTIDTTKNMMTFKLREV